MLSEQEFRAALDGIAAPFREGRTREWLRALSPIALGGSPAQWARALEHLRQLERETEGGGRARGGRPGASRITGRASRWP